MNKIGSVRSQKYSKIILGFIITSLIIIGISQFMINNILPILIVFGITGLLYKVKRRWFYITIAFPVMALSILVFDVYLLDHALAIEMRGSTKIVKMTSPSGESTAYVYKKSFIATTYTVFISDGELFPKKARLKSRAYTSIKNPKWLGSYFTVGSYMESFAYSESKGEFVKNPYYKEKIVRSKPVKKKKPKLLKKKLSPSEIVEYKEKIISGQNEKERLEALYHLEGQKALYEIVNKVPYTKININSNEQLKFMAAAILTRGVLLIDHDAPVTIARRKERQNNIVVLTALDKIHDQVLLEKIATTREEHLILQNVFPRLQQKRICKMALSQPECRYRAIRYVKDEATLVKLCNDESLGDSWRAYSAKRVKSQKTLEKLFKHPNSYVRKAVCPKLKNMSLLYEMALNDPDKQIQRSAMYKLHSQPEMLIKIANNKNLNSDRRIRAIDKTPLNQLKIIKKNGSDKFIREAANERIKYLTKER